MREIKFRCWCKEENKFYYFEGIFNQRPFIETSTFPQYESCKKFISLEKEEVFTSLKDKNKKEMYEDDIVKIKFTYLDPVNLLKGKLYESIGVVTWIEHDARFMVNDIKYGQLHSFEAGTDQFEIIGNKRENSELLKK